MFLIIIVSEHYRDLAHSFKDLLIFENVVSKDNIIKVITIAGTIFAYFSIVIVNYGDFSRYVKNKEDLNNVNLRK